jgi:hypothetical protein
MPLLEIHLTSLWHKSDIDLVGNYYLFELCSGALMKGQIIDYDATSCRHRVQYANSDSYFYFLIRLPDDSKLQLGKIQVLYL